MTRSRPSRRTTLRNGIRVLLLEEIHPVAAAIFSSEGFAVESLPESLPEHDLLRRIPACHVLGIRSKTRVTGPVLDAARELLAVGCFCIGTDQVDLDTANDHGVPVFNAPFSNTRSVAEMVLGEVICLARQITERSREVHAGIWRKGVAGAREVRGRTIGIIGYGHIGSQVGVLAEMIGMRVLYHDIVPKLPMGNNRPVTTLSELLSAADFVTLHVPETPRTKGMIGPEELAQMPRGSFLLNSSRGSVVRIPALLAALRGGHLGGAAVDVYPDEPEGNRDDFRVALQGVPNVILTPHIGGSTKEAQDAIGREVASSMVKFVTFGATTHAVNFPQVELEPVSKTHRILNVHRNVPGVLRDINRIVSDLGANIERQVLTTDSRIGYLIMDLGTDVSSEVLDALSGLTTSIKTRILY